MADLAHGEFAINGHRFGCGHTVGVSALEATAVSWRVQDQPNPVGHTMLLGRDWMDPQPVKLGLTITADTPALVAQAVAAFSEEWATGLWRGPGEESVLEVGVHGATYRAYGRPRDLEVDDSTYFAHGYAKGTAVFDRSDQLWYGNTAAGGGSVTLSITPAQAEGLVFPVTFPWSTLTGGVRQGIVTNTGTRPTRDVVIDIRGPINHPVVSGDGWEISIDTQVAYDETLTIDARKKTVTQAGASVAGRLSPTSYLNQISVPPGASEFFFRGTDQSGTAAATITWRSANASLGGIH